MSKLTDALSRLVAGKPKTEAHILQALQTKGYYVVPGFLSRDTCATVVADLERVLAEQPEKVQHEHAEGTSGDYRVFGAEHASPPLRDAVADQPWLRQVGSEYLHEDIATHFVLWNKVMFTPGQTCNSGAGWHRDSKNQQFKTIVYLTDVTSANAPFMIVPASRDVKLDAREGARTQNRFDDDAVRDFVQRRGVAIDEITGEAGTCILVDTSHIHRGKDIEAGVRYAATNYYFENTLARRQVTQNKWGKFLLKPVA